MREQAERLIGDKSGNGSMVTVWVERGGERQRLFALVTTRKIEESKLEGAGTEDQSGEEVHVSNIPVESLLSFIPEENNPNPVRMDVTFSGEDVSDFEESFESSIRIRRRTSQEMRDWGIEVPALCFDIG